MGEPYLYGYGWGPGTRVNRFVIGTGHSLQKQVALDWYMGGLRFNHFCSFATTKCIGDSGAGRARANEKAYVAEGLTRRMGRINLAADDSLALDLSHEARRQNKSLYAVTNEAIQLYTELLRSRRNPDSVLNTVKLFDIYASANAIPVPETLLDEVLQMAYKCSKEELLREWNNQGRVIGELVKGFAPTIEDVKKFLEDTRDLIPPNLLQISPVEDGVEIVMTGTGYSEEASSCTVEGLKGFLEAYGFSVEYSEVSRGFVKINAAKR